MKLAVTHTLGVTHTPTLPAEVKLAVTHTPTHTHPHALFLEGTGL